MPRVGLPSSSGSWTVIRPAELSFPPRCDTDWGCGGTRGRPRARHHRCRIGWQSIVITPASAVDVPTRSDKRRRGKPPVVWRKFVSRNGIRSSSIKAGKHSIDGYQLGLAAGQAAQAGCILEGASTEPPRVTGRWCSGGNGGRAGSGLMRLETKMPATAEPGGQNVSLLPLARLIHHAESEVVTGANSRASATLARHRLTASH